ncbi:UNVERIFIED_CONTAM: hypothetical protein HDU68_005686 [Siphonaria sp. JEL0065]|nr:hypothetical protein HDU68_005686 [Siphonaria sp. JEL0065]
MPPTTAAAPKHSHDTANDNIDEFESHTTDTDIEESAPSLRFNVRIDNALLKEIMNFESFKAQHGSTMEAWNKVAAALNAALGFSGSRKASGKNCQSPFKELLKKFKEDEMESLRASGTEEEYSE